MMQLYYAIDPTLEDGPMRRPVYLASDVDARIAELEQTAQRWSEMAAECKDRVYALEKVLREAHYFATEDFQFAKTKHYSELTPDDVCATPRYLAYWKALNQALGL